MSIDGFCTLNRIEIELRARDFFDFVFRFIRQLILIDRCVSPFVSEKYWLTRFEKRYQLVT